MRIIRPRNIVLGIVALGALWAYSSIRGEREVRIQRETLRFNNPQATATRQGYASPKDMEFVRYDTNKGEVVEIVYKPTGKAYSIMAENGELTITGLGDEIARKVDDIADRLFSEKQQVVTQYPPQGDKELEKKCEDYRNWLNDGGR